MISSAIRIIAVGCLGMMFNGCESRDETGVQRPAVYTDVVSYLKAFPIGKASKQQVIDSIGIPDKTAEIDGDSYYSYVLGNGMGKREYVYVINSGIVKDVVYHDQGPYNGSRASTLQTTTPTKQ